MHELFRKLFFSKTCRGEDRAAMPGAFSGVTLTGFREKAFPLHVSPVAMIYRKLVSHGKVSHSWGGC